MYQNIFVKTNTNEAWVWDDKKGLMHFNFQPYAYKKDPNGKFQSIHGDKLTRVHSFVKNDPNLFESDIPETTRVLVDMYGDSDMPSEGIVTMGLDIEVEMITGLPDPQLGNNEITSIAYHDSATNEYTMLVLDKRKRIESRTIGNRHIVSCGNEKDLLLKFLDGMEAVGPHILTGWNCVDAREWVSTKNGLVKLSDISTDEITSQHGHVLNKWNSEKRANKLTLSNGKSILISDEHRIPVMFKSKNNYTYMNPLIRSCKDETVDSIKHRMKTDDVYCKIPLVRNNNHTKTIHNVDILQLLGFIYTDGTYAKSKNDGRITITGIDNYSISFYANLINQNGLSVNEIQPRALKKRKDHHSQEWQIRFTPSPKLKEYLPMIYSDARNKKLSIDVLSKLSEDEIAHFISGLIDGDGSVSTNLTGITISQKPQESRTLLYDLFAYFGICLNLTSSGIFIPSKEINRWVFDKIRITHVKRNERISRIKFRVDKNTPKKKLREFCTDEFRIVKIKSIEDTGEVIPMVDIQTENHYFTVGGIDVHNCDKFDIPYLYNRIKRVLGKKTAHRLSPIGEMFYSPYRERWTIGGISTLDYMVVYKKFSYKELPSYALNAVSTLELGRGKVEYEGNLDDLMENDIETFIEYNITDVELILELDKKLQYIDLVRGICHVGHVPYEDFVYSSKYLEGALLTYLKRAGNIVAPNKPADRREKMDALKESGEQGFIGAFVKDPVPGRYEWMYDLDLTSLYPSIIMTLNISPETKVAKILNWDADEFIKGERDEYLINGEVVSKEKLQAFLDKYKYTVASNGVMYNTNIVGLIPAILNEWFDKRVEYKDEMKKWGKAGDNVKYEFYKKRQLVQKILLNSLYGVLGLPAFRFYDLDNAEAVTLSGQTVIKKTEYAINHKYNKELGTDNVDYVQYVDTDSVFVSCLPLVKNRFPDIDPDNMELMTGKIYEIATEVQNYVNGFYNVFSKKFFNTEKHRLEIKQEMIARTGFWVKKKRYALWVISDNGVPMDELKVTGLDVVRSSFPKSFQKFMKEALVDILKSKDKDEIDENVLKFKRQLNDVLFAEVAKNSSIKDIKKYEEPIKDAVLGTFAKGTPSHVKAAINYNKLLKMFKCPPKYPPIKNGDKVKVAYLKNNRYGLEELAFRGDSDPQEIIQFVKDHFDAHELFNSELDGKLRAFYDALKWEFPSEHKKNAQKFFSF